MYRSYMDVMYIEFPSVTFSTLRNKTRPSDQVYPKWDWLAALVLQSNSWRQLWRFLGRGHVATVDLRKRSTCAFERHLRLKTQLLNMYHLVMTNSSPWKIPTINGGLVRWEIHLFRSGPWLPWLCNSHNQRVDLETQASILQRKTPRSWWRTPLRPLHRRQTWANPWRFED